MDYGDVIGNGRLTWVSDRCQPNLMRDEPTDKVQVYMPRSLRIAVEDKARASGMQVATYMRMLAIEAVGWKAERDDQ
jgi:hypothetical protein